MSEQSTQPDPLFAAVGRFFPLLREHVENQEAAPLRPLDALLAALTVSLWPGPCDALDLAADATAGASTLLGLVHPSVRRVRIARSAARPPRWRSTPARQITDRTAGALIEEHDPIGAVLVEPNVPLVVLTPMSVSLADDVQRWLTVSPQVLVLVLGLDGGEEDGRALAARLGPASPFRFIPLCELAPALATSRVGLVAARGAALDGVVAGIRERFVCRYGYLDLVENACGDALRKASSGQDPRSVPAGSDVRLHGLTGKESLRDIEAAVQARRQEAQQLRDRIKDMKKSLSFQFVDRVRRILEVLAPEGTRRRAWIEQLFETVRRFGRSRKRH